MTDFSRRATRLSVCAVLVILAILPAVAQFVPSVCYLPRGNDSSVTVNGRIAFTFKKPNGSLSTEDRAQLTAERLKPLASGGWRDISIKLVGKKRAQLIANGQVICKVTVADAKAERTSAAALAAEWVGSLKKLFAMPPITITPKEITVPENENRSVTVGGAAMGVIKVADGNPSIATSTADTSRRTVTVKGKRVGKASIEVSCQGCPTTLTVYVKRYAGRVSGPVPAEVTGEPAPDWVLEEAAKSVAASSIVLEPGAKATYGKPTLAKPSIKQGETARVLVPVDVSGDNLIPTQLFAPVDVFNQPVSQKPAVNLFYSNDPEQIKNYRTLFLAKLTPDERSRLFFHHQSSMNGKVKLAIELINTGNVPASVQTISGVANPVPDPVAAGYVAGVNFIKSYMRHGGVVHKVPARSRLVIYADYLSRIDTASGIIDLRQLSGEDVYVRVNADPPSGERVYEGGIAPVGDCCSASDISDDIYDDPAVQLDSNYSVGGQWGFIRIGKNEIRDGSGQNVLFGNYGVIYEINAHIENPFNESRKVHVIFEPTAGPAAGVFVVGGQIIATKTVFPPHEFEIMTLTIPAGGSKDVSMLTMPIGGSAYPAMIVIKP